MTEVMIREFDNIGIRDQIITPGPNDVIIPAGHGNARSIISGVAVPAANVLMGTTIAGTGGTMPELGLPTLAIGTPISPGHYSGGTVAMPPHGSDTDIFAIPGSHGFTVPIGVNKLFVLVAAGGGGGGYNSGGGGSANSAMSTITVTPGQVIPVTVGAGGTAGTSSIPSGANGGDSSVGSIIAYGGYGGNQGPSGTGGPRGSCSGSPLFQLNPPGWNGSATLGGPGAPSIFAPDVSGAGGAGIAGAGGKGGDTGGIGWAGSSGKVVIWW